MQLDVLESLRVKQYDVLGQRSNDDVVDDVIESALRLAQEDVWKRMNGCVKGDLAINICGSSA